MGKALSTRDQALSRGERLSFRVRTMCRSPPRTTSLATCIRLLIFTIVHPDSPYTQETSPAKDKVQPHLLQQAITDMITQVEDIGQVRAAELPAIDCFDRVCSTLPAFVARRQPE